MLAARVAVRRLRTGVVPDQELERLSVGLSETRKLIDDTLSKLIEGSWPPSLFIHGEWGSGKTHLLTLTRRIAAVRGIPSTGVILNARTSSLVHPQHFYPVLVNSISVNERIGLRSVLLGILDDQEGRLRLNAFARTSFSGELKDPLLSLCAAWEDGDPIGLEDHEAWRILLGGDIGWADYAYKRNTALRRITNLIFLFRSVGLWGLVIALDELETIDQLWNIRSRLSAYEVLGELSQMRGVWCVFGVTERFHRTIAGDIARGLLDSKDLDENADWFLRSWKRGFFKVIRPPTVDVKNARKLAAEVANVYKEAYPDSVMDCGLVDRCVVDWSQNPARNPRRLIRLLVQRFDINRHLELR
jgi:hypothetical protein